MALVWCVLRKSVLVILPHDAESGAMGIRKIFLVDRIFLHFRAERFE